MPRQKGAIQKNWVWGGCSRCHTTDTMKFSPNTSKRSGHNTYCNDCHRVVTQKYQRRHRIKCNFGMSLEEFEVRRAEQHDLCDLCGEPLGDNRAPCVDHDRSCCPSQKSCGKCIRGIIHARCNSLLGMAHDNPEVLLKAVRYLHRWKNKTN